MCGSRPTDSEQAVMKQSFNSVVQDGREMAMHTESLQALQFPAVVLNPDRDVEMFQSRNETVPLKWRYSYCTALFC